MSLYFIFYDFLFSSLFKSKREVNMPILKKTCSAQYYLNLRTSEIHLFSNLQVFYWHWIDKRVISGDVTRIISVSPAIEGYWKAKDVRSSDYLCLLIQKEFIMITVPS